MTRRVPGQCRNLPSTTSLAGAYYCPEVIKLFFIHKTAEHEFYHAKLLAFKKNISMVNTLSESLKARKV